MQAQATAWESSTKGYQGGVRPARYSSRAGLGNQGEPAAQVVRTFDEFCGEFSRREGKEKEHVGSTNVRLCGSCWDRWERRIWPLAGTGELGENVEQARKNGVLPLGFHLEEDGRTGSVVHFKPSAEKFRSLVTVSLSLDSRQG